MYRAMAVAGGALTALMVLMNGALSGAVGNVGAGVWIHLSGLAAMGALNPFLPKPDKGRGLSWFMLTGGIMGYATVLMANWSFSILGVSLTVCLGLLGQTVFSLLTDHFGWFGGPRFPFQWQQGGGLLLVLGGILMLALL